MNDQKTESKLQVQDIQTFVEQRISIIGDKLQQNAQQIVHISGNLKD